ncbi:MAG: MBL fold metallo-hydrolase [Candidatus Ratteibacteria bacterium]|nr:MBL fold metallo-hydrolase [Candidatus Ratteibacteria bacterium]
MIIKCWGARGSIPVSGKEYIKYGGSTTCLEIRTKNDEVIIIDAGSGIRKLGHELLKGRKRDYNMIFTHAHWDHLLGFPFFQPIYTKGTHIKIYGYPFAQKSVKELIKISMTPPYFPVNFEDIKADISYHEALKGKLHIDSVTVVPISLSHPNGGFGYKFIEDDKCFVFLTDNELTFKHPGGLCFADYENFSRQADLLIHDSEYTKEDYKTKKSWGHSVYKDSLELALKADVKKFGLFHHNQERTDKDLDGIVRDCKGIIKEKRSSLKCFAVQEGMEVKI